MQLGRTALQLAALANHFAVAAEIQRCMNALTISEVSDICAKLLQ